MIKCDACTYQDLMTNVKKAKGMINKIESMMEDDRYCGDIAQQVNATIGLLKKLNTALLKSHLKTCGTPKLLSQDPQEQNEFIDEFFRLMMTSKQ